MEIKVGDKVRFLNDIGGGFVTKIIDRLSVKVMNEFGFEVPSRITELVVIESAVEYKEETRTQVADANTLNENVSSEVIVDTKDIFYPDVAIDEANCDDLKLFLAFVPQGRPGNSDLNVFFINDSNYNVLYSVINIEQAGKTFSNSVGVLEANTKEQIETLGLSTINEIPEYVFHLSFYKKGEFNIKEPVAKSININPIKFFKEKSYTENDFFNEDSIMISVYTDNALANEIEKLSDKQLKQVFAEKEQKDKKPAYNSAKKNENTLLEIDLHIHELLDDFRGLSNSEILEVQMDHFKTQLENAAKNKVKKVVFIHGVGNGTLKLEIRKELDRKSKLLSYQDASFKEYGYGATMIQFR
jgi:hypothetical protein